MAIVVTEQDKHILTLVSKGEAKSYNTVYGNKEIPLNEMLLAEVLRWQNELIAKKDPRSSSAVGKYQFMRDTLFGKPSAPGGVVKLLGIDPTQTRMTPDVQDALILRLLKQQYKLDQYKAKSLGGSEKENAEQFCLALSKCFASIPVPFNTRGAKREVTKGQSYHAGVGSNKSSHNPDTMVAQLVDIRTGGAGATVKTVEVANGSVNGSNASSPTGESPKAQIDNFATGGGTQPGKRPTGDGAPNAADRKGLPPADNVYVYEIIDPLDDRYDFRTGKKVTDITLLGTSSVAAYNQANSATAANTPASQLGVAPAEGVADVNNWTEEEVLGLLNTRDQVATRPGRYSDVFRDPYDPAALLTVPGRIPPAPVQGSTPNRAQPNDGLAGRNDPTSTLPSPRPAPDSVPNSVPGSTAPLDSASTEQTNKRDQTFKLQRDIDAQKRTIEVTLAQMRTVYINQGNIYGSELQTDLVNAKTELRQAQILGDTARAFNAQTLISTIEYKLSRGSPYGLSTNELQNKTSNNSAYSSLLSTVQASLQTINNIKSQASSLSIDLAGANYSSNLSAVPATVSFF
jgi:hypothetical protein